jgi:hypothetical protein
MWLRIASSGAKKEKNDLFGRKARLRSLPL